MPQREPITDSKLLEKSPNRPDNDQVVAKTADYLVE